MQSYTIFNKNNKVFITKNLPSDKFLPDNQIIYCNYEVLSSYNFASLFADGQTQDYIVVIDNLDMDAILKKITASLYFVKAAGGIVRNERGDFLFIYRNGFWDLPKGHYEEGETIEQTAKREVLEECGMKYLELKEYLASTFHTYYMHGRKEIKQTFWYCMYCNSSETLVPQKEEGIERLEWIKKEDLPKILAQSYPSVRYLFESIIH